MLGQGGNSNPAGNTGAGRGNSAGTGGVQSNPSGGGNPTGTANLNRSALTDGGRIFVPPQGSGGRSGGLQSGGNQSGGMQSQGGAAGLPSLGNGPRLGGQIPLGGNGTSGGNSTFNSNDRSNNPTPRTLTPSGGSGGAGSGNNSGNGGSRGSGGGSQQGGRDKDDKNKNSSNESPRTEMNLQPSRSSVADVRDVMKQDRATVSQTMQTPSDLLAKDLKSEGKIDMGRDDDPVVDHTIFNFEYCPARSFAGQSKPRSVADSIADHVSFSFATSKRRLRRIVRRRQSQRRHKTTSLRQPQRPQR